MPDGPPRLHILVEGQTEEVVRDNLLSPWLVDLGYSLSGSTLQTSRTPAGVKFTGGATTWTRIERDIRLLLGDTSLTVLTTLIDYYGMPPDAPGMADRPSADPVVRVAHVEAAIAAAIDDHRFLPHLVLHETESWVLAARRQPADLYGDPTLEAALDAMVGQAGGAEWVNDGRETAPSKRIAAVRPDFQKTVDGPLALLDLGIDRLRAQCPHLAGWMAELEDRARVTA